MIALVEPPNGSRLSCGRNADGRKVAERQTKAGQRGNAILPYLRAPGSFKRLLGGDALNDGLEHLTKGRHRSRDGGTDRFDRVLVAHRLGRTGIGGCVPVGAHIARDARSPNRELATIWTVSSLAEVLIPAPS